MTAVAPRGLPEPGALADRVRGGERAAVAAALNLLDDRRPAARERAAELLTALGDGVYPRAHVVGITGPPGSGKSSLTSALLARYRQAGARVGVLAVDPSSPRTGGALLGDRLRMLRPQVDDGLFIRSLASRGELGGLSAEVWPMSVVMLAAFDVVIVETVGVGQSEIDVAELADTALFVAQPASGDSIQFLKSGIMEVPHLFAVNKADLGAVAARTARELRAAIPRRDEGAWPVPVVLVSAADGRGVDELFAAMGRHKAWLEQTGALLPRRRRQKAVWVVRRLREEYGSFGVARLGGAESLLLALEREDVSALVAHQQLRRKFESGWASQTGP